MNFAFEVIRIVRKEEPDLMDAAMEEKVKTMLAEAIECEMTFSDDLLSLGVAGLSPASMREYLQFVADQRLTNLGMTPVYGSTNPFGFMGPQDVQELANFFERRQRLSGFRIGRHRPERRVLVAGRGLRR